MLRERCPSIAVVVLLVFSLVAAEEELQQEGTDDEAQPKPLSMATMRTI